MKLFRRVFFSFLIAMMERPKHEIASLRSDTRVEGRSVSANVGVSGVGWGTPNLSLDLFT